MGRNVYQTKNYFIAAYHYVQCYGTELVVPSSTAEVAQAMAHYYKRAQVCTYCSEYIYSTSLQAKPAWLPVALRYLQLCSTQQDSTARQHCTAAAAWRGAPM